MPVITTSVAALSLLGGWTVAALGGQSTVTIPLAVAAVTLAQCAILRRASGHPVPLSALVVVGFNAVGVAGWLFYPSISDVAAVSARMPDTPAVYSTAAWIFAAASTAAFAGGCLGGRLTRRAGAPEAGRPDSAFREAADLLLQVPRGHLLLVATLPLLIALAAYTPSGLLERPHYSTAYGPAVLLRIAGMTIPAGIAVTAMLLMRRDDGRGRLAPRLLLGAYAVVVFSMGSRQLAILPVMVLLAFLLCRPDARHRGAWAAAAVGTSVLCLQMPLTMRGFSDGAGLAPYLSLLAENPRLLVTVDLPKISGNVLFAVPLAGVAPQIGDLPQAWFLTSINPLPSSLTDWAAIKGDLRLNGFTPLSGLGELANYGVWYLVGFTFAMGLLLALLQGWNARLPGGRAAMATVIGFGLTVAPALNLLQYNLRAGTRYLWYFAALSVVLHLIPVSSTGAAGSTSSGEETHQ